MVFSVYEVVRVACLSRRLFFITGRKQTSYATDEHANDFLNAKSHAREKPLLAGYDFEG